MPTCCPQGVVSMNSIDMYISHDRSLVRVLPRDAPCGIPASSTILARHVSLESGCEIRIFFHWPGWKFA